MEKKIEWKKGKEKGREIGKRRKEWKIFKKRQWEFLDERSQCVGKRLQL